MKLYLLTRPTSCGYDETAAFVICAASPQAARKLATESNSQDGTLWMRADCEHLGGAARGRPPGIVLEDFNAG